MRWIVIGIVLFVVPYTYLTLHYRKATPAYLPYEDTRERIRAGKAGYERTVGALVRLADPIRNGGLVGVLAQGGLPEALRVALVEPLLLPADIGWVAAPDLADHGAPYSVECACTLEDDRAQPEGAQFYVREDAVYIVPVCERLAGGLVARSRETVILATAPRGTLAPGRYRVTLVGAQSSKAWTLQVH